MEGTSTYLRSPGLELHTTQPTPHRRPARTINQLAINALPFPFVPSCCATSSRSPLGNLGGGGSGSGSEQGQPSWDEGEKKSYLRYSSRLPFLVRIARNHWSGNATNRSPNADLSSLCLVSLSACVSSKNEHAQTPQVPFLPLAQYPGNRRDTAFAAASLVAVCLGLTIRGAGDTDDCMEFVFLFFFPPSLPPFPPEECGQEKTAMQDAVARCEHPFIDDASSSLSHSTHQISPSFSFCAFWVCCEGPCSWSSCWSLC